MAEKNNEKKPRKTKEQKIEEANEKLVKIEEAIKKEEEKLKGLKLKKLDILDAIKELEK